MNKEKKAPILDDETVAELTALAAEVIEEDAELDRAAARIRATPDVDWVAICTVCLVIGMVCTTVARFMRA